MPAGEGAGDPGADPADGRPHLPRPPRTRGGEVQPGQGQDRPRLYPATTAPAAATTAVDAATAHGDAATTHGDATTGYGDAAT